MNYPNILMSTQELALQSLWLHVCKYIDMSIDCKSWLNIWSVRWVLIPVIIWIVTFQHKIMCCNKPDQNTLPFHCCKGWGLQGQWLVGFRVLFIRYYPCLQMSSKNSIVAWCGKLPLKSAGTQVWPICTGLQWRDFFGYCFSPEDAFSTQFSALVAPKLPLKIRFLTFLWILRINILCC